MKQSSTGGQGQIPVLSSLGHEIERTRYTAEQGSRLHSWVGYLLSIPVIGLALLAMLLGQHLLPQFVFFDAPMFLAVIIIASIWGTGPALFAVLLGALLLDYFALPPLRDFSVQTGEGLLQLLPFLIAGVLVAVITSQREQTRQRARRAERETLIYADELTQINTQLEEANRLKGQFLSIVSHELKAPMTTILAHTQLLQRRLQKRSETISDAARLREGLEKIEAQTEHMNSLVDDLLDWSRIRSGKMELHLTQCDLGAICRDVVEEQRLVSGRVIELGLPLTPVLLQADRHRLGQVVTNLVSNALKYSPEQAPVWVVVDMYDSEAVMRISDYGPGIPEDQRKQIFELFYRTPEAQSSVKPGLGLGLAICKEIVQRHEGQICCESVVGKGSTFIVSLPLR
jgi:signal transduction histidine kinase